MGTHQLLAVVVSLDDAVIRDAHRHHQHVGDRAGGQRVHHEGQHAGPSWGRLSAAGTGPFEIDLQKLLLAQQLLGVLGGKIGHRHGAGGIDKGEFSERMAKKQNTIP